MSAEPFLDPLGEPAELIAAGHAQEVADAVVFLAGDASRYVTAQTLNVNGGLYF